MSDFSKNLKEVLSRSAKFVGRTTNTLVSATKFKTNELSTMSKRRDLISELGAKVYELSLNGFALPEEASELVKQIAVLDNELVVLRADHAAQKAAAAQQQAEEKAARAAEKAAAKAAEAIEKCTAPVAVAIPETEAVADVTAMPEAEAAPVLDVQQPETDDISDSPTLNV